MGRATSTFASARFTKPHFTSLAEFVRARKNFILSFEPFSCSLLPGPERSDLNARLRRHTLGTHQLHIRHTLADGRGPVSRSGGRATGSATHQLDAASDSSDISSDISYTSTWGEIDNEFGERD